MNIRRIEFEILNQTCPNPKKYLKRKAQPLRIKAVQKPHDDEAMFQNSILI